MEAIQIGSELALHCIAVHYQEGIEINANKCGLFLKFSSVEKICFQHDNQSYFLLYFLLSVLNCALLCDSSLLIVSAKDKKSKVFSRNQM